MDLWRDGIRSGRRDQLAMASTCVAGFVLKVSFELVTGATLFVETLGAGTVGVPLVHLAGVVVGLLVGSARVMATTTMPSLTTRQGWV